MVLEILRKNGYWRSDRDRTFIIINIFIPWFFTITTFLLFIICKECCYHAFIYFINSLSLKFLENFACQRRILLVCDAIFQKKFIELFLISLLMRNISLFLIYYTYLCFKLYCLALLFFIEKKLVLWWIKLDTHYNKFEIHELII